MKKVLILVVGIAMFFASCGNNEAPKKVSAPKIDNQEVFDLAIKNFKVLPNEAPNEANPLTEEKIALGRKLYMDKRLSKDNTQSCNTCHSLDTYGVDNQPTSTGNNGGKGTRNSPTTFNAALHVAQFWDGRNADVEEQAGGPILNPVEMEMPDEEAVIARIKADDEYVKMFADVYPNEKDPITYKNITWAIGAFERTLLTPSPFDAYLSGEQDALTQEQIEGLKVFMDAGCTTCHNGALLGGTMFMKFGLFADYWTLTNSNPIDSGKYVVTHNDADLFVFKTPSLRNVAMTYPYFHDGSVKDLGEAVKIMSKTEIGKDLTDEQTKSIVAFLGSLTGKLR
ncbi:MAG: cytochrome-c peroxidase [Bacteroidetes bacterium]|nr:MAG: cytochrome-c peroxidase [Bacteroidota bacterium]